MSNLRVDELQQQTTALRASFVRVENWANTIQRLSKIKKMQLFPILGKDLGVD